MALHRAGLLIAATAFCFAANPSRASTAGTLDFAKASTAVLQNAGAKIFAIDRTDGSTGAAGAVCTVVSGTAKVGTDFTISTSSLQWASGDTTAKNCVVNVLDSAPFGGVKTFTLELTSVTGATAGSVSTETVTIYGNKGGGTVSFSAPTFSVAQSAGTVTLSVNRSGGSTGSAVAFYSTANSTAVAGTNYTKTSGMLSWANGDAAAKSITVPLSSATAFTGTKTFAIALASPENVVLGTQSSAIVSINGGSGTVIPAVSIAAAPSTVSSGGSPTLSWSATNASTCTASGGWSGAMPTSGTKTAAAISEQTTYTIGCSGTGGTATRSATVSVASTTVADAPAGACSGTNGPLAVRVTTVRSAGVSPMLVFFNASGTTDSSLTGNTTAFQDVTYTWNFGDSGASGTETWAYGSNKGRNSRNNATGGVAAHLFITPGSDQAYTVTVTAHSGANTASCQLGVTAYDPAGANGFPGAKTTCVSASGTPVPGSGGCPAGAAVQSTSSFNTGLKAFTGRGTGNGLRVLFKCGDSFSGDFAGVAGVKWSIGAYGGCEGTQTGRPIFRDSGTTGQLDLFVPYTVGDGRISDIDLEGNGNAGYGISMQGGPQIAYQITMYNLLSNGNNFSYSWGQGAQIGLVNSVMTGMRSAIGVYANSGGNNPTQWSGNAFNNLDYQALLGNSLSGNGVANGAGIETVRISACRLCAIENNTIENASNVGAVLKLHNGNPNSEATWTGVYTELSEISDNYFGGTSGGQLVENAPQNQSTDERLRNIVVERNLFVGSNGIGRDLLVSAVNETVRNNVFYTPTGQANPVYYTVQVGRRGIEPVPSGVEAYNNTCYARSGGNDQTCVVLSGNSLSAPPVNSYAKNNLFYTPASGHSAVMNGGSGNAVSNNTATPTANPGIVNASGTYALLSDFKPTANNLGGVEVPVWYDALGTLLSTWDLGAVL